MKNRDQHPKRKLAQLSADELLEAVIEMCLKLGISGSGPGYSLFNAAEEERQKAIAVKERPLDEDIQ